MASRGISSASTSRRVSPAGVPAEVLHDAIGLNRHEVAETVPRPVLTDRPAGPPSYQFGSLPTPATATNRSTSRVTSLSTNAGTRSSDTGVSSRAINS
ncbi:MAG: hypothetical protein QOC94_2443 [Actinoplanes sp.]|nr:hypothetical protein [Actinoplanes sp.]